MFDPEKIPAVLRTVVPSLWGSAIVWLLSVWSAMPDWLHSFLSSDATYTAITGAVVGVWYLFWRWLEPKLPAWLTRILLGSNRTPVSYTAK